MKKSNKGNYWGFTELFSQLAESEKLRLPQFTQRADSDWVDDLDPELDEDDYEDDDIKSEHELFAEYYPINPKDADW